MPDMALQVERLFSTSILYSQFSQKYLNIDYNPRLFSQEATSKLELSSQNSHKVVVIESMHKLFISLMLDSLRKNYDIISRKITDLPQFYNDVNYYKDLVTHLSEANPRLSYAWLSTQPGTAENNALLRIMYLADVDLEYLRAEAESRWEQVRRTGGIDTTTAAWSLKGFDAVTALRAVIALECHNHIKLVWHQANKLEKVYPSKEASELLSFGFIGLRTALKLYDPDKGFAFSTYACTRIVGAIKDGVRSESPIPKRLTTFSRKVALARSELENQLNRAPTLDELSLKIGTDLEKLKILPRLAPESSVDEIIEVSQAVGSTPSWLVDAESDPSSIVENQELTDLIDRALDDLPYEEAEAVRLMVMEQMPPSKIRELTGTSSRQMRARRDKGLNSLRKALHPLL